MPTVFKTWGGLDEHTKTVHGLPKQKHLYQCDQCDEIFPAQYQLRQHTTKKHVTGSSAKGTVITCELCGFKVTSMNEMNDHRKECTSTFQKVTTQICRYFMKGGCLKGTQCRFVHPEVNNSERAPVCKNGPECKYFASGVCSFFHNGVGVQKAWNQYRQFRHQNNYPDHGQNKQWCRFLEDCERVPNCAFKHAEEDFPNLPNTNNPPINERNVQGWWAEY